MNRTTITVFMVLSFFIVKPCLPEDNPLASFFHEDVKFETQQILAGSLGFDYEARKQICVRYFDDKHSGSPYFLKLSLPEKVDTCVDMLTPILNDKDFSDWKIKNDTIQKKYLKKLKTIQEKRDKCIGKAAEKAGSDRGFNVLKRNCFQEYRDPVRKEWSKDNYVTTSKDIATIKDYCNNKYQYETNKPIAQPITKKAIPPTPLELVNNPNLEKYAENQIKTSYTTAQTPLTEQVRQEQARRADIHFSTIEKAHKGFQKTLASKEFRSWVLNRPTTTRDMYIKTHNDSIKIHNDRTTKGVIKMLDDFVAYEHKQLLSKKWADDITQSIKEGINAGQ